ncbi:PHOsphatase [Globomyces sp. JEL0801]|nr:PHOsphatase [Globomyces sp. JEL0801]
MTSKRGSKLIKPCKFLIVLILLTWTFFQLSAFDYIKPSQIIHTENKVDITTLLGSKSPYPKNEYENYTGTCKLQQIHVFARHAARYATRSKLNKMHTLVHILRDNVSNQTHPRLSNLTIPFPIDQPGMLAPSGIRDLQSFARRLKHRYYELIQQSNATRLFSSNSPRVVDSANIIRKVLFDNQSSKLEIIKSRSTDADLNPTQSCCKYKKDARFVPIEDEIYKSRVLKPLTERISNTIEYTLTDKQVYTLMDMCAAQLALLNFKMDDGVCYLFTENDLISYGIMDNLEKYYKLGYGLEINKWMTCSYWESLYSELAQLNGNHINISMRFSHAETIIPIVTSLGLFNDPIKPTASLTFNQLVSHQFQVSKFGPFQGNLIFEVYDCGTDSRQMRFLLNEKPQPIPSCKKMPNGLCNVDEFFNIYRELLNCKYDTVCENKKKTSGGWNRDDLV